MKLILITMLLALSTQAFAYRTLILSEDNTINFNQAFDDAFVAKKQMEAIRKCSKNPGSAINIVLYTPGGSVDAGKRLYDTLNALPCKFSTITLFAASMGYQTVQQLGERYILPSGTLMSHRASVGGLGGEIGGELDSRLNNIKDSVEEMEVLAASRVGISLKKYKDIIADKLLI